MALHSAGGSLDSVKRIKLYTEKLANLKDSLQRSEQLTNNMLGILTSFEDRITKLESDIKPIHRVTQNLTRAHERVGKTLEKIDDLLAHFGVAKDVEQRIRRTPINENDWEEYMAAIDRISSTLDFLQANMQFVSADAALAQLKRLRDQAMEVCKKKFESIMSEAKVVQPDYPEPIPDDLEVLKPEVVAFLSALCTRMEECGCVDYRKIYSELRSKNFFLHPLELLRAKAQEDSVKWHEKGQMPYLFMTHFFIKLLQTERNLELQLIPPSGFHHTFSKTIAPAVENYIETGKHLLHVNQPPNERLFILFGLYECLKTVREEYGRVASGSLPLEEGHRKALEDLMNSVLEHTRLTINDFMDQIHDHTTKAKLLSNNATVHELTTTTLKFLKRLMDHREILSEIVSISGMNAASSQKIVLQALSALEANLTEKKAASYSKKLFAEVFLMNNKHYIYKTLKSSGIDTLIDDEFVQKYSNDIQSHRTMFQIESCKKVLAALGDGKPLPEPKMGGWSHAQKKDIKARFVAFNQVFEELYHLQKQLSIPDLDLRLQVKRDIITRLVPAYTSFVEACTKEPISKNPEKYIRYPVDTFTTMLDRFFEQGS